MTLAAQNSDLACRARYRGSVRDARVPVSGGHEVPKPSEAPWMVTISSGDGTPADRFSCGGVLISPTRIATAGHCLDHTDPGDLEIRVGGGPLSARPGQLVHMRGFAVHPHYRVVPSPSAPEDYAKSGAADDVAVIVLTKPVRGVHPVPVARHAPVGATECGSTATG
ncbi:trypsin-like serine protease [Streptomyces iakyrus]|uniref:trypsin-like serine protease n=1 Tax=Streptomyces iakyrus TaxID=68219 RepID=UPI0038018374